MKTRSMKWLSASTLFALVIAASNSLEAGYGSGGGSSGYGSSGGYDSSGGYGSSGGYYGGGGSSGGYVGPLRRLGARLHDRVHSVVARRASYGSSGGSGYYSYGSSGGSHGGYAISYGGSSGGGSSGGSSGGAYYGSSYSGGGSTGSIASGYAGGSTGSYGGSTGSYGGGGSVGSTMHYGTHQGYPSEVPMMDSGYSSGSIVSPEYSPNMSAGSAITRTANKFATTQEIRSNEVHLTVNLPEAAKVYVNGNLTTTTGSRRHFISRDLKPNDAYRFEIKAVLSKDDGSELVQNKSVVIESGKGEELNFDLLKTDDPIETILTLNVPEKAKVVLAQNSTKSEGASRVFRTKQLREGESWEDYKIEVTFEGVTKEKTIRLVGGDKLEMTFSFEDVDSANKVAMK